MPELAEVVYYSRQWQAGLGEKISRVHIHPNARVFRGASGAAIQSGLEGARFLSAATHGKNMIFHFTRDLWMGGHLGMSGELRVESANFTPDPHAHLVLYQKNQALVFRDPRMFGRMFLEESKAEPAWWKALPVEILSAKFHARRVHDIFQRRARSPVKSVLLDQSCFPGIGNWMADEILWQLRLHPATLAGGIGRSRCADLVRLTKSVTLTALRTIGETWGDPPPSWLFTHRWKSGCNCPRCGSPLQREELRGRTAVWCGACAAPEA